MATLYALCGRICSGKSTLARKLKDDLPAVVLNTDELTLALPFNHNDTYPAVRQYVLRKAIEIVRAGANVVLDFGFWTRADRDEAKALFAEAGVNVQWHYLNITDEEWRRNIASRNEQVRAGDTNAYFVDEGLLQKCIELFEEPLPGELD